MDSNLTVSAEHRQPTTQFEHKVLSEMIPLPKQFSFSFKIGCFIVKAAQEPKGNRFYSTRSNSLHSVFVAFLIFKSKSLIFISGSHFIPSREQHCLTDTKFPLTIPEIYHVSQAHLGLCWIIRNADKSESKNFRNFAVTGDRRRNKCLHLCLQTLQLDYPS